MTRFALLASLALLAGATGAAATDASVEYEVAPGRGVEARAAVSASAKLAPPVHEEVRVSGG